MTTTLTTVCLMVVAIEIAAAKWVVVSTAGGRLRRKVLTDEDVQARFAALLAELAGSKSKHGLSPQGRCVVGYEAGQEGFWLVRALEAAGVEAVVIDPVSLQVDRRRKRAKTDRLDAEALADGLLRWAQGSPLALRTIRVPSRAQEDAREWQRERDRLASERRRCRDRIGKKLRSHGIWTLPGDWREQLREGRLRDFAGEPLGHQLQVALQIELARLELAEDKLKALEAEASHLDAQSLQTIEQLRSLYGIGDTGARSLALQLYWRDFSNAKQVGACLGLVGVPYASGGLYEDQGISKAGDPRLRALLIELAWLWLRYQPESALSAWYRRRTQGEGARSRRSMIVAVARKLAVALWRYLKTGEVPEGARLKPARAKQAA